MLPILLHINYFEPHRTLREACALARDLGADGIEWRRKPARHQGDDLAYLDEISRAWDGAPLEWVSFGTPGPDLMTADDAVYARELDIAERFYREAARRFPLRVINFQTGVLMNPAASVPGAAYHQHGSAVATEAQWCRATEALRRLGALGEELGCRFALETHPCYLHDTIPAAKRLVESVDHPAIGLLWDYTNLLLFPESPSMEASLNEIGSRLFYVHLKNFAVPPVDGSFLVSALSDGIIDVRHQIRLLKAHGYQGPLCLEAPRKGDREWFARGDLAYLRSLV
ncbi:MAG TPA: sugar phosphate isomerase/epimerase family protein [Chthoniobacteraceae bacterium]|nr:sugar phosphate isomerase/epimerase family protein [Chthoniobacteraceae bacterium]